MKMINTQSESHNEKTKFENLIYEIKNTPQIKKNLSEILVHSKCFQDQTKTKCQVKIVQKLNDPKTTKECICRSTSQKIFICSK